RELDCELAQAVERMGNQAARAYLVARVPPFLDDPGACRQRGSDPRQMKGECRSRRSGASDQDVRGIKHGSARGFRLPTKTPLESFAVAGSRWPAASSARPYGHVLAHPFNDILGGRTGAKDAADAEGRELRDVFLGDDAAAEDHDVTE